MSDTDWIEKTRQLREQNSCDEAMSFLLARLQEDPKDPQVYFEMACIHQESGNDSDALYSFERAVDLGLVGNDLRDTFLSLGNLFRVAGELEKSRDILVHAIRRFPGYRPLYAYYALTLHELREHDQTTQILMKLLMETTADTDLQAHSRTVLSYSQVLGQQS